jgi:FlaA1/EpsC-like NDP-sugar epimerase
VRLRRRPGDHALDPVDPAHRRFGLHSFLQPTGSKRTLFFLACDLLIFAGSLYLSFLIRFDAAIPPDYRKFIPMYFLIAIGPKVVANAAFRLYHLTWRFVSTRDVISAFLATLVGTTAFGTAVFFLHDPLHIPSLPRSILVLDFVLSFIGVAGVRMAKRIYQVVTLGGREDGRRLLIVGGGRAGEKLLREISHDRVSGYRPVGVIDDSPFKHGTYLHGIRVLGGRGLIPRVVKDERVDEVIVAMPSAPGPIIREVVVAARQAGVPSVKILPGVAAMLEGRFTLASVRDVKVEDLLKRPVAELDMTSVGEYLYGRTVLITGAAGSIGAELARQIALVEPGRLVLLEKDESRLFGLEVDLRRWSPRVPLFPVVGDVRDRARMGQVFRTYQPQVVFHAAAYKHVPMMEAHPQEAVTVNVLGTKVMAEVSAAAGAEMFVQISTDKAVNPTSVMGATKRVAEMVVRRLNETSGTRFVAVRFGNVLGSRGSLIPLLEEQIRRGGPITVTDPQMERYFMTIPEAVRLILKASTLGAGGEVFVLDMGEPVLVLDLVEALIRLSGLEPDVDVPIQFTGIRPGEKLKEEILLAEEGTETTNVDKIFVANLGREPDPASLERAVGLLADAAAEGDPGRIRALLQDLVSTYHPVPGGESDETLAELLEGPGGSPSAAAST